MEVRKVILLIPLFLLLGPTVLAEDVTLTYLGHSCFTIQEEGGPIIMIDPYADYLPYPALPKPADVVLVTHGHIDHCPWCYGQKDRVLGDPIVVWPFDKSGHVREGRWKITDGVIVDFIEATHVTKSGGGEGLVCLFAFEVGGIRFAHLADLGQPLTEEQIAALGDVDVLMIPVGGAYTIDAAEAIQVIGQLPTVKIVLPMHYFVEGYCPWTDMAPLTGFVDLAREEGWPVRELDTSQVTLSADSLPESLEVWVLPFATE
jgi:L-ascorbate metabolism protein UlaG (beta-lactamase superfamily)